MFKRRLLVGALGTLLLAAPAHAGPPGADGSVLPFPPVPSASVAASTLQASRHQRREEASHLPAGAPNILIILLDDVGFGLPSTYGGDIRTPTLSRIAGTGVSYNSFHTTAICSPTRASLLTGRNHQRIGAGTIAERAVDWDGYVGVIPKTSATVAETLRHYGYKASAFGKWHNTPADQTTAMGPFDRWPTGHGFDYFYGFVAGETSQWEPRLYENTTPVEPPHDEKYHLSEDLAEKAVTWLRHHRSYAPDKPFLMYWAPGAGHGPHQIFKEWADKYKGRFDDGWDAMRERVFKRQKELGWIPADTALTARPESMASWDSIPASQRPFQLRLMEVFAGFVEHVDVQAGKLIDELERQGQRDNTLIFYIFGDNGSSAEGQNGSISELLAQNQIPNTVEQQIEALNRIGGLDALGSPKTDNMYHAGWAWAGNTPFRYTKLIASHFGGTRNPMAVSWPKKIKTDGTPRGQFHHVNDIVPTIYETVGITAPKVVDGFVQDPIDGVSLAYTFDDSRAAGRKTTQYFDNNGSRGVYRDGWFASTFGPLTPWLTVSPGLATWDSSKDVWELYDLSKDFSQANDLATKDPQHLARLKEVFLGEARENKVFPVGAGIWLRIHPEDRLKTPYTSWLFDDTTTRMPEFTAPGLGRESSHVAIDAEFGNDASGVLYAMGGASGGLTLFMDGGQLVYEYNMMIIERYTARSAQKIAAGRHRIEVDTTFMDKRPLSPATVVLKVDGVEVARTTVQRTVPAAFTASETFDVGVDLGSPVSMAYFDRRPFRFGGRIHKVEVGLR
ncbi:arylsulfatase [Reyranella sp. MMS21-HV4-11]|uniref:Arylsulfatase n=1 Tax=Reyranella humidisoli TaxID=2849149 RepID=A0ABS6IIX5_9HYPH|nr:arylsulfatase [Reyranella sp. MMS21-HV4-11]MBU8874553.1 arylsulfatase [Reyranella sp. MMS21-HV4-11]